MSDAHLYSYAQNFEVALQRAKEETLARMRDDRAHIPNGPMLELFDCVREHLFDDSLSIPALCDAADVRESVSPLLGDELGMSVSRYMRQFRVEVACRLLEEGFLPVGRVARAAGLSTHYRFSHAYHHETGEPFFYPEGPTRLGVDLNSATWNRALRGKLTAADYRFLLERLQEEQVSQRWEQESADAPFMPEIIRLAGAQEQWRAAMGEVRRRMERDAVGTSTQMAHFLRHLAQHLCHPDLAARTAYDAAKVTGSAVRPQFKFFLGDTVGVYIEKRRLELAISLLCLTEMKIKEVAETLGVESSTLVRSFQQRLGENPSDVRRLSQPVVQIPFEAWERLCRGEASDDERQKILVIVQKHAASQEEEILESFADEDLGMIEDASSVSVSFTSVTKSSPLAATDDSHSVEVSDIWDIEEDWKALLKIACMLSPKVRYERAQWEAEYHLAHTEYAHLLDRVREIQCTMTTARALERGELPQSDHYEGWLIVRPKRDPQDDVPLSQWLSVVKRLIDPEEAVLLAQRAHERRCELLSVGLDLNELSTETCRRYSAYEVAWACLDAEWNHRRGTVVGLREIEMANAICDFLLDSAGVVPGALRDLRLIGLGRRANCLRILSRIDEAVEVCRGMENIETSNNLALAHSMRFAAGVFMDQRTDLEKALSLVDGALSIYCLIDAHLGAIASLKRAEILRRQKNPQYIIVFLQVAHQIDGLRSKRILESTQNNVIYYKIIESEFAEAERLHLEFGHPSIRVYAVVRTALLGSIQVAKKNFAVAEKHLEEATNVFLEMKRFGDAMVYLFYLVEVYYRQGKLTSAFESLRVAMNIAKFQGYEGWFQEMSAMLEGRCIQVKVIRSYASTAGGCLH